MRSQAEHTSREALIFDFNKLGLLCPLIEDKGHNKHRISLLRKNNNVHALCACMQARKKSI